MNTDLSQSFAFTGDDLTDTDRRLLTRLKRLGDGVQMSRLLGNNSGVKVPALRLLIQRNMIGIDSQSCLHLTQKGYDTLTKEQK